MRLTQFLTLSVAMSRNQAKYSIRKGRTCVDGEVIIDPNFEVFDHNNVTFDSNPISIVKYQYFMLNKPASFTCATVDSEQKSVLDLIKKRSEAKNRVELNGGRVSSSVSGNTDYLVAGESSGSKLKNAADLNIKIIVELQFLEMIDK